VNNSILCLLGSVYHDYLQIPVLLSSGDLVRLYSFLCEIDKARKKVIIIIPSIYRLSFYFFSNPAQYKHSSFRFFTVLSFSRKYIVAFMIDSCIGTLFKCGQASELKFLHPEKLSSLINSYLDIRLTSTIEVGWD